MKSNAFALAIKSLKALRLPTLEDKLVSGCEPLAVQPRFGHYGH